MTMLHVLHRRRLILFHYDHHLHHRNHHRYYQLWIDASCPKDHVTPTTTAVVVVDVGGAQRRYSSSHYNNHSTLAVTPSARSHDADCYSDFRSRFLTTTTTTPPPTVFAVTQWGHAVTDQFLREENSSVSSSVPSNKNGVVASNGTAKMLSQVEKLVQRGSAEDIERAIDLVRVHFQNLKISSNSSSSSANGQQQQKELMNAKQSRIVMDNDKDTNGVLLLQSNNALRVLARIVREWGRYWNAEITTVSPRTVFDMAKEWHSIFSMLISDQMNTTTDSIDNVIAILQTMIDASLLNYPDLAEEIVKFYLLDDNAKHNNIPENKAVPLINSVLNAWACSDQATAPYKAEALLRKAINCGYEPDVASYNAVLRAWDKSRDDKSAYYSELLLQEMQLKGLDPDVDSYSSLIGSFAKSEEEDAPDRAYRFWQKMLQLYSQGIDNKMKPTIYCCTNVIWAYANRGNVERAEQVLLEQISQFQTTGDHYFLPNISCFNPVIKAWTKSGRKEAPHMAEAILEQVNRLAKAWDEPSLLPDARTFNYVIDAWANSNNRNAPLICESILQKMEDAYNKGNLEAKPNVILFNMVLNCWARSHRKEAPERAEAILRHMNKDGENRVKPDYVTYTSVMHAWSNSESQDAADRIQSLIDEMQRHYESGDEGLKPNKRCYATLMKALARTNRDDCGSKAQAVFDSIVAGYNGGDNSLKPDLHIFNTLMQAWSRAQQPEKVESIFREIDSYHLYGNRPNLVMYNTVMNAWAISDAPNAAERSHALFDEMIVKYKAGENSLKPDSLVCANLIRAWGRSKRRDSAMKAQAVMDDMVSGKSLGIAITPEVITYNALLDAWVKAGEPDKAESILRQMESHDCTPDIVSFNTVMNGWAHSKRSDASSRTQALFDEVLKRGKAGDSTMKPCPRTYANVMMAWARTNSKFGAGNVQRAYDSMMAAWEGGDDEMKPQTLHYNFLIEAWAKAEEGAKAEHILREMESNKLLGVKPDITSYQLAINGWSRSRVPDAAHRTQTLLNDLLQRYRAGYTDLKPNLHCYGALIAAWSRSKHKDRALRAQATFDDVVSQYQAGDESLAPDAHQYSSLINAWGKAGEPEKAESILREMESNSSVSASVKPDRVAYGYVINAWSRSRLPHAAERAQRLYDEVNQKFLAGDQRFAPDASMYESVIASWCASPLHNAIAKAELVFQDLQQARSRLGDARFKRNMNRMASMIEAAKFRLRK